MSKRLNFFKNAITKKRLSHLYLLSGEVGVGKLELAYEIAALLLEDYDKRDNLLDIIKSNNHGQTYYIKPEGSVIKKDQILALQEEFTKTSLINSPRIYIIENIDVISTQAANSLLKFMEEPDSNNVYGILISSNISNVLPTIISRAQVIRVNATSNYHIADEMIKQEIDSYTAKNIAYLTKNIDDALTFANDSNIISLLNVIKELVLNWNDASFKTTLVVSKNLQGIIYDRNYYQILLDLLLVNIYDIYKYSIHQINEFDEFNEHHKGQIYNSNKLLEVINLLQDEISKQTTYINIGLSLEVLLINIDKNR